MRRRAAAEPVIHVPAKLLAPAWDIEVWAPPEALAQYHATKDVAGYLDPRTGSEPWMTVATAASCAHTQALIAWADSVGLRIDEAAEQVRIASASPAL